MATIINRVDIDSIGHTYHMGIVGRRHWLGVVRRKLFRSSNYNNQETIIVLHNNTTSGSFSEATTTTTRVSSEVVEGGGNHGVGVVFLTREEMAAITIQTYFRGHLARRAFRALRSLVKLQAVVRGVCVRRQARIALHCMHALARLQVTVRARQLLTTCDARL